MSRARVYSILLMLGLIGPALGGCGQRPGQAGLYTSDDRCIRQQEIRHQALFESVAACGMEVPDLSNDPDLQRWAALNGQPFLRTLVGRDSREHWAFCHLTGDHPGNEPTSTSPFVCESLHFTTPLDLSPDRQKPALVSAN